jgi:hypothetical protein
VIAPGVSRGFERTPFNHQRLRSVNGKHAPFVRPRCGFNSCLPDVLAAHAGSIRVKQTLRPLGVVMAGRDVQDPYKD